MTNFANLISDIRKDCPDLEHIIVTGQRTFVFIDSEPTVNVQSVFETSHFSSADEAFRVIGSVIVETYGELMACEKNRAMAHRV